MLGDSATARAVSSDCELRVPTTADRRTKGCEQLAPAESTSRQPAQTPESAVMSCYLDVPVPASELPVSARRSSCFICRKGSVVTI